MALWPVASIFDTAENDLMGGDGFINTIRNAPKLQIFHPN
jgi:hypothetical protein